MTFLKINNLSVDYQMRKETVYAAKNFQWNIKNLIASPLVGPAGNQEYLAWMNLGNQSNKRINSEYIQNLVKETL